MERPWRIVAKRVEKVQREGEKKKKKKKKKYGSTVRHSDMSLLRCASRRERTILCIRTSSKWLPSLLTPVGCDKQVKPVPALCTLACVPLSRPVFDLQ